MSLLKYKDGALTIDLANLLDHLTPEDKSHLAESLACESEIIRHVTAQILDGWTENSCHGPKGCTAPDDPAPCHGLDWATRQVAKRAGEVAAKEIARLEDALKHKEKELQESFNENYLLRYAGGRFQ